MILILGDPADALTGAVHRQLAAERRPVAVLVEQDLFAATPFWFESGRGRNGRLWLAGVETRLADLRGVLVRLPRLWWPEPAFTLQDQMFVYHETVAAWFALLSGLDCPVVNRFGLGWWLHDATYPELLRQSLAARLGLELAPVPPAASYAGRLLPTLPAAAPGAVVAYLVGERVIPGSLQADALVARLEARASLLADWQAEHGIGFCRLDALDGSSTLAGVEPFPLFADGDPVVGPVASALAEVLA